MSNIFKTYSLPEGTELSFTDSGAPLNSDDYTTVLIIHGSAFNACTYNISLHVCIQFKLSFPFTIILHRPISQAAFVWPNPQSPHSPFSSKELCRIYTLYLCRSSGDWTRESDILGTIECSACSIFEDFHWARTNSQVEDEIVIQHVWGYSHHGLVRWMPDDFFNFWSSS